MEVTYSVHPSVEMGAKFVSNMKSKTGRTVDEWIRLLSDEGPEAEPDRIAWLKSEHGLGSNYARLLAQLADGRGRERCNREVYLKAAHDYVEELFSGPRAGLRPIYEALLGLGLAFGDDVRVCPCRSYVPLYRRHVFAQIKPAGRGRIDLGLALAERRTAERLIETGGIERRDRITHRVSLASLKEVDDELRRWMKTAYYMAK
jgi:hypothetical protein